MSVTAPNAPAWDPLPLAHAVMLDRAAPPLLFLAAWRVLYLHDCSRLEQLAYAAAAV